MTKPVMHGRDHLPTGADPIPGLPATTGEDLADIILALPGLDAFWKLNETSGNIAYDSSGNNNDLTAPAGHIPPVWGQTAGPPGETSARWEDDDNRVSSSVGDPMTGFTDDFTAGVWVNQHTVANGELVGQGVGGWHGSPGGWALVIAGGTMKFGVGVNATLFYANNAHDLDTWYFVAVVRDAGTWKLYINGLLQAATSTTSPGTVDGTNTWLGNDGYSGHGTYLLDADMSYGFIADTVLTSTELLNMYETGTAGGLLAEGLVWTTDGAGSASWAAPTIEVDY